jgi:hypothetical protein
MPSDCVTVPWLKCCKDGRFMHKQRWLCVSSLTKRFFWTSKANIAEAVSKDCIGSLKYLASSVAVLNQGLPHSDVLRTLAAKE